MRISFNLVQVLVANSIVLFAGDFADFEINYSLLTVRLEIVRE